MTEDLEETDSFVNKDYIDVAKSKTNEVMSSTNYEFEKKDNLITIKDDLEALKLHDNLLFESSMELNESFNHPRNVLCKNIDESNCCFKDEIEQSRIFLKESESWMYFVNEEFINYDYITQKNIDHSNLETKFEKVYVKDDHTFNTHVLFCDLHINSLPHELLLRIFSFFSQRELCLFVAPVCSLWFSLTRDSSFWDSIHSVDYEDVSSSLLCKVLVSWCRHVTTLELDKRCDLSYNDFKIIFQNCSNINNLSLVFCSQINADIFSLVGTYLKELNSISIEGCHEVSDHSLYHLIGLPLKHFNLAYCNRISDDGAIFIARNFSSLLFINLDGVQWITESFIEVLVQKHFHSLEEIFLDGENLTDYTLCLLSKCSQLRVLNFSFCTLMTSETLLFTSQFSKLKHLKLRKGINFTKESLVYFLKSMSEEQASKFRYLNFGECVSITDECLMYIGKRFFNIIELDLSWCWDVSDDGLSFIINNCRHLKKLHLQGMHEICGSHFSKIASSLKKLVFLDLRQCNKVDDDFIDGLVKCMENLVVLNYYGDIVVNRSNKKMHLS
ncbi:F-box/LRR-repeat protein 2 [Hydra vulgaris]|uniref:F-box/LRR-repeat protein 2 n=1 Tax=Hydra vulgaris TaxID=6087 RepID=A0ABM4D4J8_HYDVU